MHRRYKELVFTDHALERLRQRKVDMGEVWATWRHPSKSYYAATKGAWVYQRNWGKRQIELVAKKNDQGEWVVLTLWSNYLRYKPQNPLWWRILKWVWKRIWV